jgi:hypothetical protein
MSFASDIAKFATKTGQNMQQVKRVVFFQLAESIVHLTPVGNQSLWKHPESAPPGYVGGRAKGNWQPSIGSFKSGTLETLDASGSGVLGNVQSVAAGSRGDDTLCLVNNLPYIKALEDGHSQRQAPHGMLSLSIQRFNSALSKAVSGL